MYGLLHRPCNSQMTQLEGNLLNIIDATIGSVRVLVLIHWMQLTSTDLVADASPGRLPSAINTDCLYYC